MSTENPNPLHGDCIAEAQNILAIAMATPRDVADVFVTFYRHSNSFDVRAHRGGWHEQADPTFEETVYPDAEGVAAMMMANLRTKLSETLAVWHREKDAYNRPNERADRLRLAAQKLMAEAESLTTTA